MQKSIWTEDVETSVNSNLNEDITCDILIIGGGIAGLSTAFKLKDENKNIVLIDKDKVAFGVTSHTTGKLTYLQGNYSKIENMYDFSLAKEYLNSQLHAIEIAKENIQKHNIECDFTENKSYLFSVDKNMLNKEKDFLSKVKIPYIDKPLPINFPNKEAFYVENSYVFHPLKYLLKIKAIIKNIKIYENTIATNLEKKKDHYIVKTETNTIKASKVIICTHYPFFILPGLYPMRMYLERSYAMAALRESNYDFNAINIDETVYSFRYHQDYFIFTGYSHSLTDKIDFKKEEDKLLETYGKHFNNKPLYVWQTHDVMTHDYLPMIGRVTKDDPNLLIATGFNKWGMTNGILAGEILSDLVMDRKNRYERLFTPHRPFKMEKVLNNIVNNFKIVKSLVTNRLIKDKPFYQKSYVTNIDGVRCGVYIDDDGTKHIVKNICPHFKCGLVFNNADKSWDCPCHGSRFDIDGNIIEGPSVYSVKIDE